MPGGLAWNSAVGFKSHTNCSEGQQGRILVSQDLSASYLPRLLPVEHRCHKVFLGSVLVTTGITQGGRRNESDASRYGRKMHPFGQEFLCTGEFNQQ